MNNFRRIKQSLRTFAKRCKDLHYTDDLLITFLITGTLFTTVNAFSAVESTSIESQRQVISTSIRGIQQELKKTKAENNKLLKNTNLELIQLMEQGDHVTKSPWSSWQYGMNYFYNDWRGTFRGRGDKKQKYPYEGIFERSDDIFLRSISSDSVHYDSYTSAANALGKYRHPATTSSNQVRSRYGLENSEIRYEPVVRIELGASVKPKEIVKSPVTVTPPRIQVNTVTPLSTPAAPSAPNPPTIEIDKFNPVAPNPITVDLPTSPTFNIKLGSYRNHMEQDVPPHEDGGRLSGTGKSYSTNDDVTINGASLSRTIIYAWKDPSPALGGASGFDSALLKAYFDYTRKSNPANTSGGKTATLEGEITIDSVNTLTEAQITAERNAGRKWNTQPFLVGGSRVATLDNAGAKGGTILNRAKINMIGPLVVGFEIQNDRDATTGGKREIINAGTLTDEAENGHGALNTIFGANQTIDLNLAPKLGGGTAPYGSANYGKITVKKGYTGYKIGMILTHEFDDNSNDGYYRLVNNGKISFKGDNSIGIQVYAPPANNPNTIVQVINGESAGDKTITLGGVKSYGLKLSSRILQNASNNRKSIFENRGTINISGGNRQESSLSSGMAVLEDGSLSGNKTIRAYQSLVKNTEIINVSGGQGNSGMVLKVKANDDITNTENAQIKVTGTKNIGMRVDLGTVDTEDTGNITPKAINKGTITINDDQADSTGNIGMVANNSDGKSKAVAENVYLAKINLTGKSTKAIGMFSQNGGEILNKGEITGGSTKAKLEGTLGMVVQPADAKKNMVASSGINDNKGKIDLTGNKVTGVYNQGTFLNKGNIATSGEGAITLYAKGKDSVTDIYSGTITAKNKALGLFADGATVKLGTGGSKALTLEADGEGTLMFYNYTKTVTGGVTNYSNTDGKFSLQNDVTAELKNGATGFYFRDTTPGSGSGTTTASQLNSMFGGSVSGKKLKMSLDEHSTLFVLDNKSPNKTAVNLSDVDPDAINKHLGNHVEVSGKNYKAYKVSKGTLNVNKDVNLDNHTSVGGSKIDDYYRVEFINSSVTVAKNQTISGTDAGKLDQVIAQANFEGATKSDTIQVTNNGTINYSKKGATAVVVDFGQATNNGLIKMDAANGSTETSVGLFGASNSILKNSSTGEIQLGKNGVGIWGKNNIKSSVSTWSKNINIENAGKITGLAGKENIFGIYADNSKVARADSKVFHSGTIDLSQAKKSIGILMNKGTLTSTGNISVNDASVGITAEDSDITINGGTHTIGEKSAGFSVKGNTKLLGNSGNISITGNGSAAYLLESGTFTSGTNFKDNLTLTSTKKYTYINTKNSTLNYENTKTINNDETVFVNSNNSTINLLAGTVITSKNQKVTGIYSDNSPVSNAGILSLTGDQSSALYGKNGSDLINSGKITIGKNGSGIYGIDSRGINYGEITIGEKSVGMRAENNVVTNRATGKIISTGTKAIGMSQSGGDGDIVNEGKITLTGDQSIGMHSENAKNTHAPVHQVRNEGEITVGDSSSAASPSIGMYSANNLDSHIINEGKVKAGAKSIGIYGGNVRLGGVPSGVASETSAGDGGIGVYSDRGKVEIEEDAKVSVGKSLGDKQEGVGVYLAGNNRTLESDTDKLTIGDGSLGYVMTGQGNTVRTGKAGTTGKITLNNNSVFTYSLDRTGTITNYNNLKSNGNENYGIYASGSVENRGNIDFRNGIGNVGAYSYTKGATTTPNAIKNYGTIDVSGSDVMTDPNNRKYGIGMAAGYSEESPAGSGNKVTRGLGNVENHGIIRVTKPDSIGMYATGAGSVAWNANRIELSGNKRNIGMFVENGARAINTGTITTVGSNNKRQIGIAVVKGILDNRGTININAEGGYGLLLVGATVINRGEINITTTGGAQKVKDVKAADLSKTIGDFGIDKVKIDAPAGARDATITVNGVRQTPKVVHVVNVPNKKPNEISTSGIGMYVDTSGINYTRPINNLGALTYLKEADLIFGVEATKYVNDKTIQLGQDIIAPYNHTIRTSGIEKWAIYSASLTWMASATQLPDYTIRNAYLTKIPYTVFAGDKKTTRDTFNFTDGLEQRYGVEAIGSREKHLFDKLNSIGNNERILLQQAFDEMMGHQYGNTQQRINETASLLDKEFTYLKHDWRNPSKQNNKIKVFGMRNEYNSDTAGIINYTSNAYGVAYVHEDEKIKMGNSSGWYAGAVTNRFRFKDIGHSKENQTILKAGVFKTMSPKKDHNGALQWTIGGDVFAGINDMKRRYLVVNEIFQAKSDYHSYGAGIKTDLGYDIRMGERTHLRPYGALRMEYGKFNNIKEDRGEIRLEVKGNDYFSVKPEVGMEFKYVQPMAVRTNLSLGLTAAYESELGKVGDVNNRGRVRYTTADWFRIRGEKDDRRGNGKFDLNLGIDNTRFGVTVNAGYDTKGKNVRSGIGFRAIY